MNYKPTAGCVAGLWPGVIRCGGVLQQSVTSRLYLIVCSSAVEPLAAQQAIPAHAAAPSSSATPAHPGVRGWARSRPRLQAFADAVAWKKQRTGIGWPPRIPRPSGATNRSAAAAMARMTMPRFRTDPAVEQSPARTRSPLLRVPASKDLCLAWHSAASSPCERSSALTSGEALYAFRKRPSSSRSDGAAMSPSPSSSSARPGPVWRHVGVDDGASSDLRVTHPNICRSASVSLPIRLTPGTESLF